MQGKWILIGSAPGTDLSIVEPLIKEGVPVICADGGMQTALAAGVEPCFFIGDLDSGSKPEDVDGLILPEEKDYTDIHTALIWALERGARDIYILGCTNGRADHYFANILLLEMLDERGARGVIMDRQNRIFFHPGGLMQLSRQSTHTAFSQACISVPQDFKYVSVLPLDSALTGVTLRGMKYPLTDGVLERRYPIGVSNELISDSGEIEIKNGRSIVILSKDVK